MEALERSVKEEKKKAKELGKGIFECFIRPQLFLINVAESICDEIAKYEAIK